MSDKLSEKEKENNFLENSEENYLKKCQEVLKKEPKDLMIEDLRFIEPHDAIFDKLPLRYRDIIKQRTDSEEIFLSLPEIVPLLKDPQITEINLNQDGFLRVDILGVGKKKTDIVIDKDKARAFAALVVSHDNSELSEINPIFAGNIPSGERIQIVTGTPAKGRPIFSLRKRNERIIPLSNYIETGRISPEAVEYLKKKVSMGANIAISGGVGTGKTTFLNSLVSVLKGTSKRVVLIEDTPEVIVDCDDKVELTTSKYVDLIDLLRSAMRLNGDIVIVGETRKGEEADVLIKIWNSGSKGGFNTIHANDAQSALKKYEQYLREVGSGSRIGDILEAINVIVALKKKENNTSYISEIAEVEGYNYDSKKYILKYIYKSNGENLKV